MESGGRDDGTREGRDGVAVKVPLGYGCGRGRTMNAGENIECPKVHCDVEESE